MTFDPDVADAYGVRSKRVDNLFALILAATVVSTMQVLGVTLIAATIVIPAVVARLINDSFGKMLVLSGAIGALCGLVGMYVSFYVNIASGATIVLVAAALFLVVFAATGSAIPPASRYWTRSTNTRTRMFFQGAPDGDVAAAPVV